MCLKNVKKMHCSLILFISAPKYQNTSEVPYPTPIFVLGSVTKSYQLKGVSWTDKSNSVFRVARTEPRPEIRNLANI